MRWPITTALTLSGPDASVPMGFMVALGLARLFETEEAVRVGWTREDGCYRPTITGFRSALELARAAHDRLQQEDAPWLGLTYTKQEKKGPIEAREIKAPPPVFRSFQLRMRDLGRPAADFAAAFGIEHVTRSDRVDSMPFDFTAANQKFIAMMSVARQCCSVELLAEAIDGPWDRHKRSPISSFRWDPSGYRPWALSGVGASGGVVPGAEILAAEALPLFPAVQWGRRCGAIGWRGRDALVWPVWSGGLRAPTIRALMSLRCEQLTAAQRASLGLLTVYRAHKIRIDGYFGDFAPSEIL